MVSFMEPIHWPGSMSGEGGTISATALPKRVMRSGFLVRRTRSNRARHLALNSGMAISSIEINLTIKFVSWSQLMVIIEIDEIMRVRH